jgi:hypothetical protein
MNSTVHVHVTTETRGLLFILTRTMEQPELLYVLTLYADGRRMTDEGVDHYLHTYEVTITNEIARKLKLRPKALTVLPLSLKDAIS